MELAEEKKQEIENSEHNLKLLYEAKKSALETMLRSVIPAQLSSIKTVLWMNFLIMGLVARTDEVKWFSINTGILVSSGTAIIFCLYAFIAFREKHLGSLSDVNAFSKPDFPNNEWSKYHALLDSLHCVEKALVLNTQTQNKTSDLTAIATCFSIVSMLLVIIKYSNQL